MPKIIVHVFYDCTREVGDAFVKEMKTSGVYQSVLDEDGCERYEYMLPVEGNGFCLLEQWYDETAFAKHLAGEPMAALKKIKDGYPMQTTIEKFRAEAL